MNSFVSGQIRTEKGGTAYQYEYFLPSEINRDFIISNRKIPLALEEANRLLGELNAYGALIPDIDFFIQMHVRSEAVSSSKIEGTKTGMDEALLPEEDIDPEKRDDWKEVQNYIFAMNQSIKNLKELPVSVRLIKEAHKILLSSVRGQNKLPGELRRSQNWIGGASINSAHFVPPHHDYVSDLMADWERFWHNQNVQIPTLIKIAICHYQFETIHPFLDGNGRIGRLLIILQLLEREFIKYPVLYISDFFESHRQQYYDALNKVRHDHHLDQWILFFLDGIIQTSQKSKKTFEQILSLKTIIEDKVAHLGRRTKKARALLQHLYSFPIISVKEVEKVIEASYPSANNLVNDLVDMKILKEITGHSRNRLFALDDYIKLFRK